MTVTEIDVPQAQPTDDEIKAALEKTGARRAALVDLQFSDIAGGIKSLTIPGKLLEHTLRHGYRFDGSALSGGMRRVELDLYLAPDPTTLTFPPARSGEPQRAQLLCWVLRRDGSPFPGDPRSTLERILRRAAASGFDYQVGIEMEFYLLQHALSDRTEPPALDAGYFDIGDDLLAGTRDEIVATLDAMHIGVGGAHHETGPGQQELDLLQAGGIRIADQIIVTRQVIRSVAERRGLHATFMAKPFADAPGSGMHMFQRLARLDRGDDLLRDPAASDGLSETARHFIAGQLLHARAVCAVLCTTVNSYKRLAAGHRAPQYATWARVSQASLIRVPAAAEGMSTDIELRSADAMANPYLAIAASLGAALDGIKQGDTPPAPLDENLVSYDVDELHRLGVPMLPTGLGEALDALGADPVMRESLGNYIFEQMLTVKRAEWSDYQHHVSPWERLRYGDV